MHKVFDKPLAPPNLTSYRYRYGPESCHYIMIGATSCADALNEARRSLDESRHSVTVDNLQVWNGTEYVQAKP